MSNVLFKLTDPIRRATLKEFQTDNPGIVPTQGADLTEYGYAWGSISDKPDITDGQALDRAEPVLTGGFVSQGWTVRDKTPEQIANEAAQARERMVVNRWQFATACMIAGIVSSEEAMAWSPGNALPAGVEAALSAAIADPNTLAAAKIKALSAPTISRTNPLIAVLQQAYSLTDEQVDGIFETAAGLE